VIVQPMNAARPTRIEDLDALLAVSTGPSGARLEMRQVSMSLPERGLRIGRLIGTLERHGELVSLTNARLDLPRSHLKVDGNIRGVPTAPTLELAVSSGAFAFDEMAKLIPGVPSRPTQATFTAAVKGPFTRIATDLDFHSPAGDAKGNVLTLRDTGDARYPLAFQGEADLAHVDPALWSNTKAVAGRVDGHALFHVDPGSSARQVPTRGTFTLARANADVAGYSAREAEARGTFTGARVTLERARGRAYGGTFDAAGVIGPRDPGQPGVRFNLTGRLTGMDVRRLPPPVPKLNLQTAIAGRFQAHLDGPAFDATLTFDDSTVEGGRVGAGSIGRLAIAPGTIRYGGTARIDGLDLGRLGTALDLSLLRDVRVAGPITGDIEASLTGKTLRDITLKSHAVIERATVAGGIAQKTTLDATIADRRLDVELDGDVAKVDPAVAFTMPSVRGEVSGHVKGHFAMPDLAAPASVEGVIFNGDLTLGPSRVAGRDITDATMTLALADGILGVTRLEGTTPLGTMTASGPLALNTTGATNLAYTITGLPLAGVRDLVGDDLTGRVDATGTLHGTRQTLTTDGTLTFDQVQYATTVTGASGTSPYTIALPDWDLDRVKVEAHPVLSAGTVAGIELDTGDAQVTYADRHAHVDVRASSADRRVHAAGDVDLTQADRRHLTLDEAGLSLGETTWVLDPSRKPRIELGPDAVTLEGIRFDDGSGQIAEASGTLARRAPATSNLNVSVRGFDLLPLEALVTEETPEFAGLLNGVARITGAADKPDVLGSFAIERGRYRELRFERIAGAVHYDAGRAGVDVVVEQAPGVTLAVNGSVPLGLFTSSQTPEGERADAGLGTAPIDLNIESSAIGLEVVTGLTTAITQVGGTATVKLHITGTADNPLFDGGVTLAGGAFTVPTTGRHYRDLATTVRFEPGRMHVDDLKLLDEEGDALQVEGVLGLRRLAFGDVQMHARAKKFGFVGNDLARLEVDLELDVTGQVTRPTIAGTAVIENGRVEVDRLLASLDRDHTKLEPDDGVPIVGAGQKPAPPPPPAPEPPPTPRRRRPAAATATGAAAAGAAGRAAAEPGAQAAEGVPGGTRTGEARVPTGTAWSRTSLDVRVQIPENLLLRGQNIRRDSAAAGLGNISLVVGGDFRVQKERRRPTTLVGTVTTVRGSYEYYGRRFEILRDGRIQFQGADPSDPTLDVTARRIIQPSGIEARIRVQGTARTPTLSFSSTPPLDESDILALIIFNRDLNSLGASEQGTVATMAGTAAAGMVVSPLADTLGRKLGLEEIDVQTTNDASGPGGVVTVGDQLGDRLFVRLRQQFGAQEVSELLLEYRLSELLRLQGSVAEGDGVGRANRSLTRRVERGGLDVVFYYQY